VGSFNCAGVSLFKLKTIMEMHTLDILCIQETWLPTSSVKLDIPGYLVYEERRANDRRGGIAVLVKKGMKVRKYVGNEYAQGLGIQGHGGETIWIGNIYLPPATNLETRGLDEENAKTSIEDILGNIPPNSRTVVCGDWNTRVGNLHPKIGENVVLRQSEDTNINARAQWVIGLCESNSWYILNGI
jgi:exonuclease III